MKTQVYYYKFDTKSKPGMIIAHGIRFETNEFKNLGAGIDEAQFKILCDAHPELKQVDLKSFKEMVATNFR